MVDIKELEALLQRLEDVGKREEACQKATNDLAGRFFNLVVKATPKGEYPLESGKKGGTLQGKWNVKRARKSGNTYTADVINNTEYASYVEYGHRQEVGRYVPAIGKRLVQPYVPPKYFVKKTEEAFEPKINEYAKTTLEKYLQGVLDGK